MKIATILLIVLAVAATAAAQSRPATTPTSRPAPAAAVPSSQPAVIDQPFEATVIKVERDVRCALPRPDGKSGEFKPVNVGDKLPAGAIIRTGLRSKVMLTFGDDAVVLIDRVTLASIDQFHRAGDTKKIQLGLGHGLIRAATVETTLRSDMTISSPVATLSKRGTIDFGMRYESGTGRYTIWLNQEGLVEAFDHLTGTHRKLEPGQYVTQALLRWIETLTMDRYVPVVDAWGTTSGERAWDAQYGGSGIAVVNPGAGANNYTSNFTASYQVAPSAAFNGTTILPLVPAALAIPGGPRNVNRPEGNFGTGLGR